jgi:hypothetical protein
MTSADQTVTRFLAQRFPVDSQSVPKALMETGLAR